MKTLEYVRKKRSLGQGIAQQINSGLQCWPARRQTYTTFDDVARGHYYKLMVHTGREWSFYILDGQERVVLYITYAGSRLTSYRGLTNAARHIRYVEDVPNAHAFGIIAKLLGQLPQA